MTDDTGQTLLYTRFGTTSPFWRLTSDSDALHFAEDETAETRLAVALNAPQTSLIRSMTVITSSVNLTLLIEDKALSLHLVGRKINQSEWAGTASARGDIRSEAHNQVHDLAFAEQMISDARSVIVILDRRGNIQRFNRLSEEYSGLEEREVIGRNVFQLFMTKQEAVASRRNITGFFRSGHSHEVERWIKTRMGPRLFLFRNKFVHSGSSRKEIFLICSGSDITEERRAQERLRVLANTDAITGLPNRNAIIQETGDALEQRGDSEVGLVSLELNNLKKINDMYGQVAGDQLLQAVSLVLLDGLGKEQTLGRSGSDEFLILAENTHLAALETLATRILERLKQPFRIGQIEIWPDCSVGIAISPQHGEERESLVSNASTAMHHARAGRNRCCVFNPEMNQRVFEYLWLDTHLRKALESEQLVIQYQPKIDRSGQVTSAEALVYWNSPERGLIPPSCFMPCAAESGLIVPLERWMLLSVLKQVMAWRAQGINLRVAVNMSLHPLSDKSSYLELEQTLKNAGLESCPIDIELTENCLTENGEQALALMKQFRQAGAAVHLAVFGTGYTALARLPVNAIKLDQSFIRNVNLQPVSQSLVRAIVAVAKTLNLQVIAAGIETAAEDSFVMASGVDMRQGALHAQPMPADALEHWLAELNKH